MNAITKKVVEKRKELLFIGIFEVATIVLSAIAVIYMSSN